MATVADAVATYGLEPIGEHRYRMTNYYDGPRPPGSNPFVFGGQLLAQMVVAAGHDVGDKLVKTAHAFFARPVQPDLPIEVSVDVLQRGRAFASASLSLEQEGRERARALVLLSAPEPDLLRYADPMPDVPGPDDVAPSRRELVPGADLRVVGDVDFSDPATVAPARLATWVRFAGAPADRNVAQAFVTVASARFTIPNSMLPYEGLGENNTHKDISSGVIGHTVAFHREADPSSWLLVTTEGVFAGDGTVFGRGQVFTPEGDLVASFSQDGMVRNFREGTSYETSPL